MMGRQSTEGVREWWSRLGAWLGIYGAAWMVIAVAAVYGPQLVQLGDSRTSVDVARRPAAAGSAPSLGGLVRRRLRTRPVATSAQKSAKTQRAKEIVAAVAPFVFIAGLLIGVADAASI